MNGLVQENEKEWNGVERVSFVLRRRLFERVRCSGDDKSPFYLGPGDSVELWVRRSGVSTMHQEKERCLREYYCCSIWRGRTEVPSRHSSPPFSVA